MPKFTVINHNGRVIVQGPVSSSISGLIKYARAQGLQFRSYKIISDPFTSKFRTFGIQLIG